MGPQQGDPLGPMLFSLPLQKILRELNSQLAFGYLDDVTLGGRADVVATDVQRFEEAIASLGLRLNQKKCELIAHSTQFSQLTQLREFTFTNPENATLLGSPLLEGAALEAALDAHNSDLPFALSRLIKSLDTMPSSFSESHRDLRDCCTLSEQCHAQGTKASRDMMHCSEPVSKRSSTSPLRKAVGHKQRYRQNEVV